MRMLRTPVLLLFSVLALACGGAFSRGNEEGGGGASAGGTATSGGQLAGSSTGGSRTAAGASSGTGPGGGFVGEAGAMSVGASSSCDEIRCAVPLCPSERATTPPGACCPVCSAPKQGCEDVKCETPRDCEEGYELTFDAGACCPGCLPKVPNRVACNEIACPETPCQPGYVRGDVLGGCCYQCLPDPLYCTTDSDCVAADKPRSCCGCPEVITRRQFAAESCWWEVGEPRSLPTSCYPDVTCDAVCAPCVDPERVACQENRCVESHYGLK
jgi:hypothetical protein